jgi:hypothetical protein
VLIHPIDLSADNLSVQVRGFPVTESRVGSVGSVMVLAGTWESRVAPMHLLH